FNNPDAEKLIANKKGLFDNVIPSSNPMMARNLLRLGLFYYEDNYSEKANNLLNHMKTRLKSDSSMSSNWAHLYLEMLIPIAEIAIVGKQAVEKAVEISKTYRPNFNVSASDVKSLQPPLLEDKTPSPTGNALIYVCFNRVCQKPVTTVEEAV